MKECRRLTPQVVVPKSDIDPNGDYRVVAAKSLGGIAKANKGLAARNRCEDKVISNYAKAA